MNKKSLPEEFDGLLDALQSVLLSFLIKLGPFFVALMPAMFTAYAIFYTFRPEAGDRLAFAFAVIVGLALETVGIVATHTAIDLYNAKEEQVIQSVKFRVMVALIPVYIGSVAGIVGFSGDAFTDLVRSLGIASPFLTCVVYVAVALARDLRRIEQKKKRASQHDSEQEQADQAHKRRLELEKLRLEQQRKLREAELSASVRIERAKAKAQSGQSQHIAKSEPAQASIEIECEDCGRTDFDTVQGLNAHRRWCDKQKISANGKAAN